MSPAREPPFQLRHPALSGQEGVALDRASLGDQQRLAVVLQAAGLLAHLEHGGWVLPRDFRDAQIGGDGRLLVPAIEVGRVCELPQLLLRHLLERLFRCEDHIAGRGEARGAARWLQERWHQTLVPIAVDTTVAEILDVASFLWQPPFALARTTLVAEHAGARGEHVWIAAPALVRRRLLARSRSQPELERLLGSQELRPLWEGCDPQADPRALAEAGRWRQAAAFWYQHPPSSEHDVLEFARILVALGRYSQALETVHGITGVETRLLRARCQLQLGQLQASQTTLSRIEVAELEPEQHLELAEVAVRLHANRGQPEASSEVVTQALRRCCGPLRSRASILAAEAAWDRGDAVSMEQHLETAGSELKSLELRRRWHQASALRAQLAGDGHGMARHLSTALRLERRQLLRADAGRLWNDLALARVLAGDLPGAERACRHTLRLLGTCEGPSRITLALYNLAEVRLRRGRPEGVGRVLEASMAENRRAGNLRGLVRDLELWVRYELARGRASAALARCAEALDELDRRGSDESRELFRLLAARAHGWLGQRVEAAASLDGIDPGLIDQIEAEERPALWALCGDATRALAAATDTGWLDLWRPLLADVQPSLEAWEQLHRLEPYRAARLVFDCELARPSSVPPLWVRRATVALRNSGAEELAEKLESRAAGPWLALESYLQRASCDRGSFATLMIDAGYPDVRITLHAAGGEEILIDGSGGAEELVLTSDGTRLSLRAMVIDRPLRTLFMLVQRDFPVQTAGARDPRPRLRGLIGEHPSLMAALARLDRLAHGELPILVLGESGTGKELVAREAHRLSPRSSGPFLAVNCAAFSETLVLSDLFGHVRGAFTNADRDRPGVFESARGGTVFLDEIGDLPPSAQGMLLRVLQEGEIRRVGETFVRKVDVRIVAATHRDLAQMVENGTFRQDLYFRLKVATILLPPLRERGQDVFLLAQHFLERKSAARVLKLAPSARARLLAHPWPGNVRELENVMELARVLVEGATIEAEHLDLPIVKPETTPRGAYHTQLESFRRNLVMEALSASNGNQAEAARRLDLTRQALSYLVRQLKLS